MKFLGPPSSGSQADTTASHNRAGQYYRNRRSPVQPVGTGRRATARSNFGSASSAWASLTFSQQAAWQAYADSHPITDSLGSSIKLTGHQMFVSIYSQLLNCETSPSTTPPVSASVYSPAPAIVTVSPGGLVIVTTPGNGGSADFLLYAFSQPKSSGVTFNKTFWQAGVGAGDLTGPQDYSGEYVGQFGLPPVGSRVFYRLTPVNQYGVKGTELIAFAQVAALDTAPVVTAGAAGVINWTNGGGTPDHWNVMLSTDGGITWSLFTTIAGATLTATGLTSGALARIWGADSADVPTNEVSNSVTVV
jgi:hypothetical protein